MHHKCPQYWYSPDTMRGVVRTVVDIQLFFLWEYGWWLQPNETWYTRSPKAGRFAWIIIYLISHFRWKELSVHEEWPLLYCWFYHICTKSMLYPLHLYHPICEKGYRTKRPVLRVPSISTGTPTVCEIHWENMCFHSAINCSSDSSDMCCANNHGEVFDESSSVWVSQPGVYNLLLTLIDKTAQKKIHILYLWEF